MVITVIDANDLPTPPGVSNLTIAENRPVGTLVGTLSSIDEDSNDPTQFRLTGSGNDNAQFTINGNQLLSSDAFDFEQKSSYNIEIQAFDKSGNGPSNTFKIQVVNVNEAPTGLSLSAAALPENQPANSVVGTLSTTDADAGESFTYSFATGAGDSDNGSFAIVGNTLQSKSPLDFETKSSYIIRLRTTDFGSLWFERSFTIGVTDVNETPTDISLSPSSIVENSLANTVIGSFSSVDQDASETFTYQLVSGPGSVDNNLFGITGTRLVALQPLNYEQNATPSIRVRSTDSGGNSLEKIMVITVIDANDLPTPPGVSNLTIAENRPVGTLVGTLSSIR